MTHDNFLVRDLQQFVVAENELTSSQGVVSYGGTREARVVA